MRALFVTILLAGCGIQTLDNETYRRLLDRFDSYDDCLAEGDFSACYQTLTFCDDGRLNANLDFRQEGPYKLRDTNAIADLPKMTLYFDLMTLESAQLPGRHDWEEADPIPADCAGH